MPEDPEPKAKPTRDPQALTSEYHKARKQLMLWAGILFIWALVGIDLQKAQEAGGNTGALIKSIKSPQAVPWVLLIMVGYFLFKLSIEWRQCNISRRQVREARMDYYSACIVASAAIALYFGQAISNIQFADILQDPIKTRSVLAGFGTTIAVAFVGLWVLGWLPLALKRRNLVVGFIGLNLMGPLMFSLTW